MLQTVDLADGTGLEAAVASQCIAEAVVDYVDVVAGLARSALGSDTVKRAATRPHWRESYVGTVLGDGTVLEGVVDLVYREDDVLRASARRLPCSHRGSRWRGTGCELLFLHPDAPARSRSC